MVRHHVPAAVFAIGLLAAAASAQIADDKAPNCVQKGAPISQDYAHDREAEWPKEAQRFKSNEQLVSREQGRLRLTLGGGKTTELIDCPYGESAYWYLYDRFDPAGRFHVVRRVSADDLSYALVMMPTGRVFTTHGAPVWTSEKSKFLTIGCSLQPPRGSLVIHAPAGEGLATEAEFELPCDSESCSARWDHQSWISVTCAPRDGGGKKGREFVLIRGNDGTWKRFGR